MKPYGWVFLVAAVLASAVGAQQSPSEVTDAEIARHKVAAKAECMAPGIARGDPKDKVEAFCTCVIDSLTKSMTRAEWQQAYFYALKKQEDDHKKVLAPHVQNLGFCWPK